MADIDAPARIAVETMPDAVVLADDSETITYLNPAAQELLGYAVEEAVGQPVTLLVPERLRQAYERDFRLCLSAGESADARTRSAFVVRHKSGADVPVEISLAARRVGGDRYLTAILRDLSSGRATARWSPDIEGRYRTLVEHLPQTALVVYDHELRFQLAAGPALEHAGWHKQDVEGKTLWEVIPIAQARSLAVHYRAALRGENRSLEYRSRIDGRRFWLRIVPLYDGAGEVVGGMAVSLDITQREVDEDSLRSSEERFRSIFNWAGIGIAQVDLDGRLVETNAALDRMLGYRADELSEMTLVALSNADDAEDSSAVFGELIAGERDYYELLCRMRHKRGSTITAHLTVSLVRAPSGQPRFAIAMVENFTDRTRAEQERLSQVAELAELARTDSLTGLPNRRAWEETLPRELVAAGRTGRPLCLAILDLDDFKRFNDRHGHQAGDRMLAQTAGAWHAQLRLTDTLARYRGEEFAVLLPNCPVREAVPLIERLRMVTPSGQTCSAGIARWDGLESGDSLLARADAALYEAKRFGRNRSHTAPPP